MNKDQASASAAVRRICQLGFGGVTLVGLTACSAIYPSADGMPTASPVASTGGLAQPRPQWSALIPSTEVDVLQPVSADRFLAGTLGRGDDRLSVSAIDFRLIERDSGKTLWVHPRGTMMGRMQTVLAVDPVILVKDADRAGNRYVALDRDSGALRWQRQSKADDAFVITPSLRTIVVAAATDAGVELQAIDLASGQQRWNQRLPGRRATGDRLELLAAEDTVVLVGQQIVGLALASGAVIWRTPSPGTHDASVFASLEPEGLLVAEARQVSLLDHRSGKLSWTTGETKGRVVHATRAGSDVHVVTRFNEGAHAHDVVSALNARTGTLRWSRPLGATVTSGLISSGNHLLFTSGAHVQRWDLSTGAPRFTVALPERLGPASLLPDLVVEHDQKVIVARETSVAAFDLETGAALYAQAVADGRLYTYAYNLNRESEIVRAAAAPGAAVPAAAPANPSTQSGETMFRFAQAHERAVYARTEAVLSAGGTTAGRAEARPQRQSALRERVTATDSAIGAKRAQIEADKRQASIELAGAIIGALTGPVIAAVNKVAFETTLNNTHRRVFDAVQLHANSLNLDAGVYVRPYYRDGQRLAVIDLASGRRADLVLSPDIDPLRTFTIRTLKLPAFSFDASGTRLVVKTVGLDPAQKESYQMLSAGCDGQAVRNWTLPFPALRSYDVEEILRSASPRAGVPPRVAAISELDRSLIRAAFAGNLNEVKKLLGQGARVNAVDEDGHTALMHAALAFKPDVVELLVRSGAESAIQDEDCQSAMNYLLWPSLTGAASPADMARVAKQLLPAGVRDKR